MLGFDERGREALTWIGGVRRLAEESHEPQATWVAEGQLDELRGRLAWSRANRHLVDPLD